MDFLSSLVGRCQTTAEMSATGREPKSNELGTNWARRDPPLAEAPGCLHSQKTTYDGAVRRCGDNVSGDQEPEQTGRHERISRYSWTQKQQKGVH